MKRLLAVSLVIALATPVLFAATVTGMWSGTLEIRRPDGSGRRTPALVILKQDGDTVTGSAGASESNQTPIRNGKVNGDRLTFEVESGNQQFMRFDLKVSEDVIEGSAEGKAPDGGRMTGRLMVKRLPDK